MKKSDPSQPPTVALALGAASLMAAGFIGIVAVVLPGVLLMVVAGFGLLLFFIAQYFVWGRWLFPIVQRMEKDKEDRLLQIAALTDKRQWSDVDEK